MLYLLGGLVLLTTGVQAGYDNRIPWQQYYTPPKKWSNEKTPSRPARIRVGHGRYRMLPQGAELICDFPPTSTLISNVIWQRVDLGTTRSLDEMYRCAGEVHRYQVVETPTGSRLLFSSPSLKARGLYRCIATAIDRRNPAPITIFQDVQFYPSLSAPWNEPLRQDPCYGDPFCRRKHLGQDSHYSWKSLIYY